MIKVTLLGTGGTMPLPERALTALCVRYQGHNFLIDCGEGTQVQLRRAGISIHDIDVILITHFHADHVTGLQGLLLSMSKSERKETVRIIAPKGAADIIRCLCVTAPAMPFPINIIEIVKTYDTFDLFGMKVAAQKAEHSVVCYAYSMQIERRGRFMPERAMALGIDKNKWKLLQQGQIVDGISPNDVLGAPRKGLKLTYCTDTRPTAALTELAIGSDLFICEGMYADMEKLSMAREKKHMMFSEAAETAKNAQVKELWLTHFSPSLRDVYSYVDYASELFPNTLIPHDLQTVELVFDDEAAPSNGSTSEIRVPSFS